MSLKSYEGLELSTQIVITEALTRGVEVDVLDRDDNFIRLKKGSKVEYVKQATKTSADTYISPSIMGNKEVTKLILKEQGINVPESINVKDLDEALKKYSDVLGKDIVIKPKSTNFGEGVLILKDLKSQEDYKSAVAQALEYDSSVMIEEFIPGREYRFLVIKDEVVAVMHRVPANVVGDGLHSIRELVSEKNKSPLRGKGHVTPLEKISIGTVEVNHLASQGKDTDYVPQNGEVVYLRENSNISTGGDSIDFTDEMLEEYKIIAVKSARAVGAKICGADMIIQDVKAKPDQHNHSIIELNFNPVLYPHNFPCQGQNRHVEKKLLDLLGF
ncbi:bifunctional glutamate--cysteine ligase GshA/glutathione synthetase GshB [Methanobacterium aggregans]|uniref:bifunctional glutamate--cysteine ligase GshA/glutathione synthetase GshB n=1 Tax=Methanobacterium aggregans TaxID=1615586 RepID=UPI001AEAB9D6|nr:bifunctional glutamate--cysteine ligase GshA/glutathione synthetase GshB [Methanobacterium aggregans]MBP2045195.1 glutamate--cysteine ligase [Methanobacterium aggregans]